MASLMSIDMKRWDVYVVKDIFNDRDQRCILSIPLVADNIADTMYWRHELNGMYSVKSAYKHLQLQKGVWNVEDKDSLWSLLWRIKAPPKALNLVWRALANCLPTLVQLQHKQVTVQARCPVCDSESETILHSLVTCTLASQCWSVLSDNIICETATEFTEWLNHVFKVSSEDQNAEIVMLCWAIWHARNEFVLNQKAHMVNRIVASAKQGLTQWKAAQDRLFYVPLQPNIEGDGASTWVKPHTNTVKVSFDAVVFSERQEMGVGLIARDSTGNLLQAKAVIHAGHFAPVLAEAMEIKEALSWIAEMQFRSTVIESDCLTAVQAIRSKTSMRSHFGMVIEECRRHIYSTNNISLYFIKRSANMVAHTLARASYNHPGRSFDRWSVPIEVKNCIELDLIME